MAGPPGGGDAGGGRGGAKGGPQFVARVPKFLEQHAHLLGKGTAPEGRAGGEATRSRAPPDDWEEEEEVAGGAGGRAGAERAAPPPPEAEALKLKGARQFAAGQNREAEVTFTRCVELCPDNAIYRSNRSAARATLSDFRGALEDAELVTRLRPAWGKGFGRAGVALFGLKNFSGAREAYRAGLAVSPGNSDLEDGLRRCEAALEQLEREGKHVFVRQSTGAAGADAGVQKQPRDGAVYAEGGGAGSPAAKRSRDTAGSDAGAAGGAQAGKKQKGLLSFQAPSSSDEEGGS